MDVGSVYGMTPHDYQAIQDALKRQGVPPGNDPTLDRALAYLEQQLQRQVPEHALVPQKKKKDENDRD